MANDMIQLPFVDGTPVLLTGKTSSRSDGSTMFGRWSKERRGRVEVRLDLRRGDARTPVARFALEMN